MDLDALRVISAYLGAMGAAFTVIGFFWKRLRAWIQREVQIDQALAELAELRRAVDDLTLSVEVHHAATREQGKR